MMRIVLAFLMSAISPLTFCEAGLDYETTKFSCYNSQLKAEPPYERCSAIMEVHSVVAWSKIACFGEVAYKTVSDERVTLNYKGFLNSVDQVDGWDFPSEFQLPIFIYFNHAEKPLEPNLSWVDCMVIN